MARPPRTMLAEAHPELVKQWHPTKNGVLTPRDVGSCSGRKVWWKCPEGPDHEWTASPDKRTIGQGCPFCAGRQLSVTNSLAARFPNLAKEWHPTKNGALTPSDMLAGSATKVWWKCREGSDHEWLASPDKRGRGCRGCPYCDGKRVSVVNRLVYLFPGIGAEWHPSKNGSLQAKDFTAYSNKKVWWKCACVFRSTRALVPVAPEQPFRCTRAPSERSDDPLARGTYLPFTI